MARDDCTTYYTRAAWALCVFGTQVLECRYADAAERNVRFGLAQRGGAACAPWPGRALIVAGDRRSDLLPGSAPEQHDRDRPQHDAQVL